MFLFCFLDLSDICVHLLDINTAFRELSVSLPGRTVSRTLTDFKFSPHRDRFDYWPQILCSNAMTGRCYWEVDWTADWLRMNIRGVDIAVSYKDISRKGDSSECGFGFNQKSWSLMVCYGYYCIRHHGIESKVGTFSPSHSGRVAVYLDCPAGTMSFYRVTQDKLIHIQTINNTFTGPLYAGFGLLSGTEVSLN
ncbi:unnamed protein product [Knipowitschia caucasica]